MLSGHEATLLAALINGRELPPDITAEHFSIPAHRTIFSACEELRRTGTNVNLVSVTHWLTDHHQLERVGGAAAVTEISGSTLTDSILDYVVEQVREASRDRRAQRLVTKYEKKQLALGELTNRLAELGESATGAAISWNHALTQSVVTSHELGSLDLRPRKPLLGDWFKEGDLGFLFAFRGVGKTWFALLLAKALSEGAKLGEWQAHERVKVLYVDGEMPADLMRARDKGLQRNAGAVEFLNHEILFDRTQKVLNITHAEVQRAITTYCLNAGIKVVILDNLSTLASGMKENDSFDWEQVNNWLLEFRRHKIAVIVVHHAGRNGEARGTSKREDNTFWVITLDDAKKQADDKRGARFISRFTKPSRNTQNEIPAYEWHVVTDAVSGMVSIACKAAQSLDVFRKLIEEGVTQCGQLAAEMKVSEATISRLAKKGFDAGWLTKNGREYAVVEQADKR